MHKLFDKLLALRMKEVFQSHQETYRPGDWEKMRTKMSQDKKTIAIWFPYIAKAATVALLLGLSVFTVNDIKFDKSEQVKLNGSAAKTQLSDSTITKEKVKKDNIAIIKPDNFKINNKTSNFNKNEKPINSSEELVIENENIIAFNNSIDFSDSSDVKFANIGNELNKQREEIKKMENTKQDSSQLNLMIDNSDFEFVETKNSDKRFEFGVELASVSNYALEGTGKNINVGGGVSTSWHISKNFSLSTGVLISRQSINYNQNESSNILMDNIKADYALSNSIELIDINTAESKLEFVGIDIPINLQFRHKRMVLTTGVSSILYIQETYNDSYSSIHSNTVYNMTLSKYETQNSINQITTEKKSNAFSHFDFARLLNIAVGYQIPLSKGELAFEPYLKLPIGSISSYQVKMGSGGMALKYYF